MTERVPAGVSGRQPGEVGLLRWRRRSRDRQTTSARSHHLTVSQATIPTVTGTSSS
jgi:hypothetical protein